MRVRTVCVFLSFLLLVVSPGLASADLGHPDSPDVVVATGSGDRSTWFPAVERLRDGALLVVYYDAARKIIGGTYSRLRDYLEP